MIKIVGRRSFGFFRDVRQLLMEKEKVDPVEVSLPLSHQAGLDKREAEGEVL